MQIPSAYNPDYKDISPRLGLAWDVTGKGTTVVRLGGSMLYNLLPINSFTAVTQAAQISRIPTGFALFMPNGSQVASPGNIQTGNLAVNETWAQNVNVFNPTAPANAPLACGEGTGKGIPNNVTLPTGFGYAGEPAVCNINGIQLTFPRSKLYTWTLGVQHAFTNNISLNVAYVGTSGIGFAGDPNVNAPLPGVSGATNELVRRPYTLNCPSAVYPGESATATQFGWTPNTNQCFPYLGTVYLLEDKFNSNYNGLQVALHVRATHGLTLGANFTYSRCLDSVSNDTTLGFEDNTNPKLSSYGPCSYNFPTNLNLTATYAIPGRKSPGQLLEGWELNWALNVLGAEPVNVEDASTDLSGTGQLRDHWSIFGDPKNIKTGVGTAIPCFGVSGSGGAFTASSGCIVVAVGSGFAGPLTAANAAVFDANLPQACRTAAAAEPTNASVVAANDANATGLLALANFGCYFENGTAIVPPAQGTFGNMARNVLRNGLPYRELDMSVTKTWKFKERLTTQFRGEAFNVLNQTIYANPAPTDPSAPATFDAATALQNAGDPILGSGGPRQIQLGLRFVF